MTKKRLKRSILKDNSLTIFSEYFLYFWNPLIFSWCLMSTNRAFMLSDSAFPEPWVFFHLLPNTEHIRARTHSQISCNSKHTHPSAIIVNPRTKILVHVPRNPFNDVLSKLRQILSWGAVHGQRGPKRQKSYYPTPVSSCLENFVRYPHKSSIRWCVR